MSGSRGKTIGKAGLILAGLLLFIGKLFYDLNGGATNALQVPFTADLINHILPYMTHASATVRSGALPLWNPYTSLGSSMVGELGIGLFHPTMWVIFLLNDTAIALLFNQLLVVFVGMTGMYLYGRYLGFQWPARILSVTLFGYTVFTESFSHTEGASYCWIPIILYFTHRCFDNPSLKLACCIAGSLALCFLGGFPNFFFYTCLIVGTYLGTLLIFSWKENRFGGSVQRVGLMMVAVILMTGLVAIQLIPAYELSALSVRSLHLTTAYDPHSIWENYSAGLAFGNFLFPDQGYLYANRLMKMDSGIYYLGAALLLVPFAFINKQHRKTAIALSASCAVIVLFTVSYQVPALSFIHDIPFVGSMRVNGRAVAYFAFFLIVLASLGLSEISGKRASGTKSSTSIIWSALFLTACTAAMAAIAITAAQNVWAVTGLLLCAALIVYSMLGFENTSRAIQVVWVIVIVIIIDVSIHRENRFLVPAFDTAVNPFVESSKHDYQSMNDYYRLLLVPSQLDETYTLANLGLKLGIPNISAYDSFTHARWLNYIRSMIGPESFDQMVKGSPLQRFYGDFTPQLTNRILRDERILGLASVRYLYSPQRKSINEHALPRAYAVHHYIRAENEEQSLAAIKANMAALRESVVLENASPTYSPDAQETAQESNEYTVQTVRHAANEVELAVVVTKPSIVVLTDAYYPGWKAYIDGRKADIFRANSLFRAVEVPAGTHSVLFRYEPTSFYLGIVISLLTLCFVVLLLLKERHYQKYRRSNTAPADKVNWH